MRKNDFNLCGFATNQSGVGRGYFSENQFWNCHNHIIEMCRKNGLEIDFTAVNFLSRNHIIENLTLECLIKSNIFIQ